eukprot:gene9364-10351_t
MDHGTFCLGRETFGISINKELLTRIGFKNCTAHGLSTDDVFSDGTRVVIGASWLILIITGAIGNILVLFVISYPKQMRTIPNWLLFNLALADSLMTIVALPILGLYQTFHYPVWQLSTFSCYILNCATHIGAMASGASLTAISVHRFIVIRIPRKIHIKSKHLYMTIVLIWIIAIGGSASSMTSAGVIGMIRPISGKIHMTKLCIQINPTESEEEFQLAFRVTMYVIYSLFLIILYANTALFLWNTVSPGNQNNISHKRKRQAVKMLFAATASMIITYLPYMVLVAMTLFAKAGYFSSVFGIEIFCNMFLAVNHVINPFIYCAFSTQFREGFKLIFQKILQNFFRSSSSGAEVFTVNYSRKSKKDQNGQPVGDKQITLSLKTSPSQCNARKISLKNLSPSRLNLTATTAELQDENSSPSFI